MHQRTYDRLLDGLLGCEEHLDSAIAALLGRLMSGIQAVERIPIRRFGLGPWNFANPAPAPRRTRFAAARRARRLDGHFGREGQAR